MSLVLSRKKGESIVIADLVTILVVGVIAAATSISLLLLGWAAEQNGITIQQGQQALEYAQTCVERSLRNMRNDPTYVGDTTITFTNGSCTMSPIGGIGNTDRAICVAGITPRSERRIEVLVSTLLPTTVIGSWQEVSAFTLCP